MKVIHALGAALLTFVGATLSAQQTATRASKPRSLYEDLQLFSGVLNQIRVNHPDTAITAHELIMAAIRGMVQEADPYSAVFPGSRFSPEKQKAWLDGKLYPVGVHFSYVSGAPVVMSVTPGSSAARLDILRGDQLITIDGKPVVAESAEELDITLAGEKKSSVTLTLERRYIDGRLAQFDRTVRREKPSGDEESVPVAFMLDPYTGYVRITTFNSLDVDDDLHDAVGDLEKRGMQRLMLDIRDNSGGYVRHASKIAGEFLPKGAIVYTVAGRKSDVVKDTGRVSRSFWSREKRYPIVLMINSGSASASELVAGALQDHDRALIVGQPSHGKALMMGTFPIDDGGVFPSLIYLNIGQIRTPCGRVVQRDYRGLRRQDYYRRARSERDTTDRPSCKTNAGRTVYGGGGIFPDVVLPEAEPTPVWLSRMREEALPLKWIAGHLTANPGAYSTLEALTANPALAGTGLADFRSFAASNSISIPPGHEADRLAEKDLVRGIAFTKWGDLGLYRIIAVTDPEIAAALQTFGKAADLVKGVK
ncbi:MAG: PDZ domain-containing protein [Anaerolineae bacterium]|nr:PDZ domain-containing protein [Gemmatimonadaceae bacterium]